MRAVLLVFWNLCLLRRGPESVPTQRWFIGAIVALYGIVQLYLAMRLDPAFQLLPAVTYLFVSMAVTASMTWFVLYLRSLEGRFPATFTALLGCELLLLVLLGILVQFTGGGDAPATIGGAAIITVWTIIVSGFVLHRAMNVSFAIGVMLALAIGILSIALGNIASPR